MKIEQLIATLQTCDPSAEAYVWIPDDNGEALRFPVDRVERGWRDEACSGLPDAIGIVAA
jgi:hypothetical protein